MKHLENPLLQDDVHLEIADYHSLSGSGCEIGGVYGGRVGRTP